MTGQTIPFQARTDQPQRIDHLPLAEQVEILRETVIQLQEALAPSNAIHLSWGLTNAEEKLCSALLASTADYCTRQRLYAAIYGCEGDAHEKIVDVYLFRARKKLAPFVQITSIRGRGWRIDRGRDLLRGEKPVEGAAPQPVALTVDCQVEPASGSIQPAHSEGVCLTGPATERIIRGLLAAGWSPREIARQYPYAVEQVLLVKNGGSNGH